MGDVDLFGFEQTSLAEKKTDFQDDMSLVYQLISYTDDSKTIYLNNLNTDIAEKAIHIMTNIIKMIARRLKALREVKLSLQRSVHKFVTMAEKEGKDWRT